MTVWIWTDPDSRLPVRSAQPPSKADPRVGDPTYRNKLRSDRRRIGNNLERLDERRAAHGSATYHRDNNDDD